MEGKDSIPEILWNGASVPQRKLMLLAVGITDSDPSQESLLHLTWTMLPDAVQSAIFSATQLAMFKASRQHSGDGDRGPSRGTTKEYSGPDGTQGFSANGQGQTVALQNASSPGSSESKQWGVRLLIAGAVFIMAISVAVAVSFNAKESGESIGAATPMRTPVQQQPESQQPKIETKIQPAAKRAAAVTPEPNLTGRPNASTTELTVAESFRRAEILYRDQNYKGAAPLYDRACTSGNADACKALGYIYHMGLDMPRDDTRSESLDVKAVSLYSDACNRGDPEGCKALSDLYGDSQAWGVPRIERRELPRKIKVFTKACDAGSSEGCIYLGLMYDAGDDVAQDFATAAALFSKACDASNAEGCVFLGTSYLNGAGVSKDVDKARNAFKLGCTLGSQHGCDQYREIRQHG